MFTPKSTETHAQTLIIFWHKHGDPRKEIHRTLWAIGRMTVNIDALKVLYSASNRRQVLKWLSIHSKRVSLCPRSSHTTRSTLFKDLWAEVLLVFCLVQQPIANHPSLLQLRLAERQIHQLAAAHKRASISELRLASFD